MVNYTGLEELSQITRTDTLNPVVHGYGFGPYTLAPGETANFTVAEVVGYGAGVAGDSIYNDIGGSSNTAETGPGLHPIPSSMYKKLSYDNLLQNGATIGSDYLQTHPLPWYVDATSYFNQR